MTLWETWRPGRGDRADQRRGRDRQDAAGRGSCSPAPDPRASARAHRARSRRRRAAVRAVGRAARRPRRASSTRRRAAATGRRSSRASRRRCRAGSAARRGHPPTSRPTSPAPGCSRPRSSSPSTRRRPAARPAARRRAPRRRADARARRLPRAPHPRICRCCSSSRAAPSRAATRSTGSCGRHATGRHDRELDLEPLAPRRVERARRPAAPR